MNKVSPKTARIEGTLRALRQRIEDDQAEFDYYAERSDETALSAMCFFIENKANQGHTKEAPEFAFLYTCHDGYD